MHTILTYLTGAALIATVFVLIWGIITMLKKDHSPEQSNKLMRWRIFTQIFAIVIFSLFLLTRHS